MNEKILLIFILNILNTIDITSKNIYEFLSQFLTEASHSFGFKPLDDLIEEILLKLKIIYNDSEEIEYQKYEKFKTFKEISLIVDNLNLISKKDDKTYQLFLLIFNILENLEKLSKKNGKLFSTLIEDDDISPNILFDLQPIYNIKDKTITKFDKEIIGKLNNVDCEEYEDYFGILYNFIIKDDFYSKGYIIINNNKISTKKELYKFLKNNN